MKSKSLILLLLFFFFLGCEEKEEIQYAKIYFPLSAWATKSDFFIANFDYAKDTTYIIGAYCGSSISVPQNVEILIGLAVDSLKKLQKTDPSFANYEILPVGSYDITPADTVAVIKKNTSRGDLKVTFRTTTLEPTKQYVLPLHIKSTSHYEVSDQHSYLFFGINKQ